MINDAARQYTDKELARLERALQKEYTRAAKELSEKWAAYMQQYTGQGKPLYDAMLRAKASGDKAAYAAAKREYQRFAREHTLRSRQYQRVRDNLANALADLDRAAKDIINGRLPYIYSVNFNALAADLPAGYAYGLITPQTVRNLALRQLDFANAVAWNKQLMNSEVLQGILHGESMDKIAERFARVLGLNETAAIRDARTAVTDAENKGRLDSYYEAEANGTVLVKVWSATHDERTRDSHMDNDGIELPLNEEFPNGQQRPGDPTEPAEYYNCRCALGTRIIGFRRKDGSIVYV